MAGNPKDIESVQQTLSKWGGQRIIITKEENGDVDQTMLDLEQVELEETSPLDDYRADHSIQLIGKGQTVFEDHQEPLPYQTFDIPVENITNISVDQGRIIIRSDRGIYTIKPV